MRLLLRTSIYYLAITFIVFSIGSIILYNIFLNEIEKETDLYLVERFHTVVNTLNSEEKIRVLEGFKLNIDTLKQKPEQIGRKSFVFSDTMVMHQYLKRLENNRKMTGVAEINNSYIRLTLFDVLVESDDIMDGVIGGLIRLYIFLGVVMMISSFLISRSIFKPFNRTLEGIRNFNIKDLKPLNPDRSKIREFNQLNHFIEQMTEKVSRDYRILKEFSENASHEIQTPISIAKGKLELMLQSDGLSQDQMDYIESAYKSLDHISKLGQSLSLLAKIENEEFSEFQDHDLSDLIKKALEDFRELIDLKNIKLQTYIRENVNVNNDANLLRIMINNLLNNALRHNREGGEIRISLDEGQFVVANTGEELQSSPEILFDRFKKDKQASETLGLGLAIVKKIVDLSGYDINYTYEEGWHKITVRF